MIIAVNTRNLPDDFPEGYGTWQYRSGDRYEGDFSKGKRNGHGTYFFNDGTKYSGNFFLEKRKCPEETKNQKK